MGDLSLSNHFGNFGKGPEYHLDIFFIILLLLARKKYIFS